MALSDDLGITSKYDVIHRPTSKSARQYLSNAPDCTMDGDVFLRTLPEGVGYVIGKNMYIVHPFFGRPRNFYLLHQNQLEFIADMWKNFCHQLVDVGLDPDMRTPLLLYGQSDFCRLIDQDGKIVAVQL